MVFVQIFAVLLFENEEECRSSFIRAILRLAVCTGTSVIFS